MKKSFALGMGAVLVFGVSGCNMQGLNLTQGAGQGSGGAPADPSQVRVETEGGVYENIPLTSIEDVQILISAPLPGCSQVYGATQARNILPSRIQFNAPHDFGPNGGPSGMETGEITIYFEAGLGSKTFKIYNNNTVVDQSFPTVHYPVSGQLWGCPLPQD